MGRGLAMKELSSFTGTNLESLFHEQRLTSPRAQQVGFETTKSRGILAYYPKQGAAKNEGNAWKPDQVG
jgi:hypothetical protein